ncbi:MAG: hypothetical protein V3T86_17000 [Planctomycetota bacterium]
MLCKALSLLLIVSSLLLVPACRSTKSEPPLPRDASGQVIDDGTSRLLVSLADLRKQLAGISDDFLQLSGWAAAKVRREDDSFEVHRETFLWERWAFGFRRHILAIEDPRVGWIDIWSLSYQIEEFVREGEGALVFGKGQETAVAANVKFREKVEETMQRSMSRSLYAKIQPAIKGWAANHRMVKGTRTMHRPDLESMRDRTGIDPLGAVLSVPVAPFKAIGGASSGIKGAPEAIRFAASTLGDTAELLPHQSRLEAMLFMHDMRRNPIVVDAMDNVDRVTEAVEAAPDNMTRVLNETLDNASEKVAPIVADAKAATGDIREATENVRQAVEDAKRAVDNVRPMPKEIEAAVKSIREDLEGALNRSEPILLKSTALSDSVRSTVQEVAGLIGDLNTNGTASREQDEPSLPMDKLPDMLDDARITAEQVRLTTADLRAMMAPEDMERTMTAMGVVGRDSIDHISWRAIQVALAIFGLAIAYRFIRLRWLKG